MSQVSLGSVMMIAEAREQAEEESIKRTVAVLANFIHFILPGWVECYCPWQEWVWDGNHLKGKNLLRRVPVGRDLICLFPYHSEVKPFLFFHAHSPHLFSLSSSPELTSPSHILQKVGSAHAASSLLTSSSSSSSPSSSSLSSSFWSHSQQFRI